MEELLNIVCLPIIVAIVYVVMAVYKHFVNGKNEAWTRLIPVWAAVLGAVLGIYAFYKVPQLMIADNVLCALLVGLVSGLSAVGFNQIKQQISKIGSETAETTVTTTTVTAETAEADAKTAETTETK